MGRRGIFQDILKYPGSMLLLYNRSKSISVLL
jgi:hypothetical protein